MKRSGFTMIELIFVIVILGILASVAIPKLAATRDDAKIATVAQQVQSAISEIPAYVTAKGSVDGLDTMSQVIKQMSDHEKAVLGDANNITNGRAVIKTLNNNQELEDCFTFEVNATHLIVTESNATNLGKVCKGVKGRVKGGTYMIAGQSVVF